MEQEYSPSNQAARVMGTYARYDGVVWKERDNERFVADRPRGRPCFALWNMSGAAKLGWFPRIHGMQFTKAAEECYEYAVMKVYRKVFKGMPTWSALRKNHSCRVVADLDYESMVEVNFRWRVLRSIHEAPSDLSSCAAIANLAPDLEAPWVLGLASLGDWSVPGDGVGVPYVTSHRTYHSTYDSGDSYSLARVFAHIQEHGRLFAGHLENQWHDDYQHNYAGVTELTSWNSKLRVTGAEKKYRDKGTCIEIMRRVRAAHLKNPTAGSIRPNIKDLVPAVNEDESRKRIW